jgi:hypothetical protein
MSTTEITKKNSKSKFAQHVLEEGHSFGPMDKIMDPIYITKKGGLLNALEKYYIYKETQKDNQINDKHTIIYNPIFEAILKTPTAQKRNQ